MSDDCFNKKCPYFNIMYINNCWDIGETYDCEDFVSKEYWENCEKNNCIEDIIVAIKHSGMSLNDLGIVKDICVRLISHTGDKRD